MEAIHSMGADAVEDVAKIGEGADLMSFARGDAAREDCGGSPAVLAAEELCHGGICCPTAIRRRLRSAP